MSASNSFVGSGRLTADPKISYTQGERPMCIAMFTIAINRKYAKQGTPPDYIPCKAFGKTGEFVDKYFKKGMKVNISGEIHTNTYTNRDGQKVNGWEINVIDIEFGESKAAAQQNTQQYGGGYQNQGYGQPTQGYQQQSYAPQSQPTQQYARQPQPSAPANDLDGFMNIPDGISDAELPFA